MASAGSVIFSMALPNSKALRALEQVAAKANQVGQKVQKAFSAGGTPKAPKMPAGPSGMSGMGGSLASGGAGLVGALGGALGITAGIAGMVEFGKSVFDTTAKFEKYNAVLVNTLGSQNAATEAMNLAKDVASNTPASIDEVTNSFVKLANRGILASKSQLISMSDVASSTGKSLDMFTEAILDAQTGELERLKEFGITGKQSGDKIAFTFKGQTTEVKKSEKAIADYLFSLGQVEGVAGASASQMNTLGGKVSQLKDKWDMFTLGLGQAGGSNLFGSGIDILSTLLDKVQEAVPYITALFKPMTMAFERAGKTLKDNFGSLKGFFGDILGGIGQVFKGLGAVIGGWIEGIVSLMSGVARVYEGIKKGNFSEVLAGGKGVVKGAMLMAGAPFQILQAFTPTTAEKGKETGAAGAKGSTEELDKLRKKRDEKTKAAAAAAGAKDRQDVTSTISGQRPQIVNINIDQLIRGFEVHTQTLNESMPEVRRIVVETLLDTINNTARYAPAS